MLTIMFLLKLLSIYIILFIKEMQKYGKLITLLIMYCIISCCFAQEFEDFKKNIQSKLILLRDEIQEQFNAVCQESMQNTKQCSKLSYNMCIGIPQKQCITDFPTRTSCIGEGAYLTSVSGIRFPNHIQQSGQLGTLDEQFTCATANVQDIFNKIAEDRNHRFGFTHIASVTGAFRSFPSFTDIGIQGCTDFDPRMRSWYVKSMSGYKNMIIVLDTSRNTNFSTQIVGGITAIKALLDTVGPYDFIRIITFNSEVKDVGEKQFRQMDDDFKEQVIYSVSYILSTSNPANYEIAFKKIGQIISSAGTSGAPCSDPENMVFFISSGKIDQGMSKAEDLTNLIKTQLSGKKMRLFTYSLGSKSQTGILKSLACQFNGMLFEIPDEQITQSQMITRTQGYYNLMYSGHEQFQPIWSESYQDYFGYGKIVTVSLPIFYLRGYLRKYLGLVSIDIKASQLQKFTTPYSQIQPILQRKYICQNYNFTLCCLQNMRRQQDLYVCPTPQSNQGCQPDSTVCYNFPNNLTLFKNGTITTINQCCSLSVGGLIGIIIGGIAFFLIIILLVYRIQKKKLKKMRRRKRKMDKIRQTIIMHRKDKNKNQLNLPNHKKTNKLNIDTIQNNDELLVSHTRILNLDESNQRNQLSAGMIFEDIENEGQAEKRSDVYSFEQN